MKKLFFVFLFISSFWQLLGHAGSLSGFEELESEDSLSFLEKPGVDEEEEEEEESEIADSPSLYEIFREEREQKELRERRKMLREKRLSRPRNF